MNNTIITYAGLSKELKAAFKEWLAFKAPQLISFPLKGKHMKGYVFNHQQGNYLVVMQDYQLIMEDDIEADYDDPIDLEDDY